MPRASPTPSATTGTSNDPSTGAASPRRPRALTTRRVSRTKLARPETSIDLELEGGAQRNPRRVGRGEPDLEGRLARRVEAHVGEVDAKRRGGRVRVAEHDAVDGHVGVGRVPDAHPRLEARRGRPVRSDAPSVTATVSPKRRSPGGRRRAGSMRSGTIVSTRNDTRPRGASRPGPVTSTR